MVTAICAWLRRKGVQVAPFKAQNMSNNSFPCAGGGEIGRAQVAQAQACGLEPEPVMNPVLLKPSGNGCQVVVNGQRWKTLSAREYYTHTDVLASIALDAYRELARRFDVVVIEGAGSVSELNLRPYDFVNLGLVTRIDAPWVLVADIERGGVFASVIGTVGLLTPAERRLFRGFLINKFRGDRSLFTEGVGLLEGRTGAPCLGVFPYADDLHLDAEDSLAAPVSAVTGSAFGAATRIAIVRLPHLSNSTDFRLLASADWLAAPARRSYDAVILPGTTNTLADLAWLRTSGLAAWILRQHAAGARIVGICGGYQMLGRTVRDPDGVESPAVACRGLGLLPADTVLATRKVTRTVTAMTTGGSRFSAYEIHLGRTALDPDGDWRPFARLDDGQGEGAVAPGVIGTYLHGALEDPSVCAEVLGVNIPAVATKAETYGGMADWFECHARGFDVLRMFGPSRFGHSTTGGQP
jgi:adenosylcobyric acid synthase